VVAAVNVERAMLENDAHGGSVQSFHPEPGSASDSAVAERSKEVIPSSFAAFVPARAIANAHLQTVVGTMVTGASTRDFLGTVLRRVEVSDGDSVVLNDDRPEDWSRGSHVVLMLHGLSGCHGSGYMMRIARKLNERGVRTFRMDHRGCGAADGLASYPYHAGRIDDLHRSVESIERLCPGSAISVVGFSLSGNLLLRYLGDHSFDHSRNLFRAVAVCPPVDLKHCVSQLDKTRAGQRYDWYFTRRLIEQISNGPQWRDDVPLATTKRLPRRLYDFDDMYTAPASGFDSADHYYQFASACQCIGAIRTPTTILAAADDPLVCVEPLRSASLPLAVTMCLTEYGGHLGFLGRRNDDRDRRWMDWRVIEWLLN
jgi:predicted alpha/beta-fold hydrolase